ncbi:MAG: hypothetical protein A2381_08575 [Bdellovibrionales bacterium RIFOXYB1_FULL_37_110]|nr:MAG: hypothetical protein A2417_14250 [Bdellovibrionales bacterium RIFOXYC1_FULL_37_79]OFZ58260.1 MAG: hypothetical protein A2381_08575 [Bdellovibrionales bacterium RIFOXYB1_FULL_37_110]
MGLREQNKLKTKNKILAVSTSLFLKNGFDNVGIRDIVSKSGISIGTYYNYFTTKEDIVFALIDEIVPDLFKKWSSENMEKQASDVTGILTLVFKLHFDIFSKKIFIVKEFFNIVTNPNLVMKSSIYKDKISEYKTTFWNFVLEVLIKHNINPNPHNYENLKSFFWAIYITSVYYWIQDTSPKKQNTFSYLKTTLNTFLYGVTDPSISLK